MRPIVRDITPFIPVLVLRFFGLHTSFAASARECRTAKNRAQSGGVGTNRYIFMKTNEKKIYAACRHAILDAWSKLSSASSIVCCWKYLAGLHKLSRETFFRVCTQEMNDLSQKATKLIECCLEVLEEVEEKNRGKPSLARLETALDVQYAEQYENQMFQYGWALRHQNKVSAKTE
jgi:hypothetical protein